MKKIIKIFILLIIIYSVLLTAVFSIPNSYLHNNQESSYKLLNSEGMYPSLSSSDWEATRLDNFTDKLMIEKSDKKTSNFLKAAFSIDNYPRYWHGYQLLLRPLLVFVSYGTVRQLYSFMTMLLLGLNLYLLAKKKDIFIALSFFMSFYFVRFYALSINMQFSNVFILMLICNIFLMTRSIKEIKNKSFLCTFFVIGSLTNFTDLLTAPLITLGVPLVTLLYFKMKINTLDKTNLVNRFKEVISLSFSWALGYGLTWVSKWILASVILKENIIMDAFDQAIFRTEGSEVYPLNRMSMFKNNVKLILNNFNITVSLTIFIIALIILIYNRNKLSRLLLKNSLCFLVIGVLPFIWYFVMANHSQIHYYFTYRTQIISVYAALSFFSYLISNILLEDSGKTISRFQNNTEKDI
ncbi:hypothetical protein [Enterococcus gilvus]|uniref:hypothetical protein n=1 Tax=Enterococcus gilvus TaxID=160453 RepID=UPI00345E7776